MSVLVGTNDSPEGRAALAAGAEEAQRRSESLVWMNLGSAPINSADIPGEARELPRQEHQDPADALLDAAVREEASAIVIGLRRRSPVGKLLMGSVVQRVLLDALVPVVAVKAEQPGK